MTKPLAAELLQKMDAYWRAANYISIEQIYLWDNPLLKTPLMLERILDGERGLALAAKAVQRTDEADTVGNQSGM